MRRVAFGGAPEHAIPLVLSDQPYACGFRIGAGGGRHGAQAEVGPSDPAFPVAEIFSARMRNELPRHLRIACSRPDFGAAAAWHASWIRGDRDAPGGLPSLSPRHGLSLARRHRGTCRCLMAPVVPLPSTRVPAWPHGTVAGKDDAAGCRKRKDGAGDAAGSRSGRDDAAGCRIREEAAGRRTIKDEAAGCRTGPATEAGPPGQDAHRRSSREWGAQGLGGKPCGASRVGAASGKDAWRGRSCKRPAPWIFRPRSEIPAGSGRCTIRARRYEGRWGNQAFDENGSLRGALDGMRR